MCACVTCVWPSQEPQWVRSGESHTAGGIRRKEDEFALLNRAEKSFTKNKDADSSELAKVGSMRTMRK